MEEVNIQLQECYDAAVNIVDLIGVILDDIKLLRLLGLPVASLGGIAFARQEGVIPRTHAGEDTERIGVGLPQGAMR